MQEQQKSKTGFFKTIGYMVLLLPVIAGSWLLGGKYIKDLDWHKEFANTPRVGSVRSAGEATGLDEASDYRVLALLSGDDSTCTYFIDEVEYPLPSPYADYKHHGKYNIRGNRPLDSDLKNIEIEGKSWSWKSTLRKDDNSARSVLCDGEYLLVLKPTMSLLREFMAGAFYFAYWSAFLGILYWRFKRPKNTSK